MISPLKQASTQTIMRNMQSLRMAEDQEQIIPKSAIPFFADGAVPMPAAGIANQVVITSYQVQIGYEGYLMAVMANVDGDGGAFIEGSGQIVWTIDIDIPLGNPLATGRFLPGYSTIERKLGSFEKPWPIVRGWRMHPFETYRFKVYQTGGVPVGSPCFAFGSLLGVVWPTC